MLREEKGITPVIAIVLLLLITVGAVGVVYTQFQGLTSGNDAQERLNDQQTLQAASYSIVGVSNGANDNITVTVKNTADDTTINLTESSTMQISRSGQSTQAVSVLPGGGDGCFWTNMAPTPGESTTCFTGVDWPTTMSGASANDGQDEEFELLIQGISKDSYTCDAGNDYC